MTTYLLGTDTCSYIIKERPPSALKNFERHAEELLCISVITYAELIYGVERSSSQKINLQIVEKFIEGLVVYSWDTLAAKNYASLRNYLEKQGKPIGNMDMMIAAHAKAIKAVLVTNNSKHFKQVPALKIENWI